MVGNFPAVFNFNRLFLKFNRFICNPLPVLPLEGGEARAELAGQGGNSGSKQLLAIEERLVPRGAYPLSGSPTQAY